ncbi:NAD(P)-dependent oxidoreductase [Amycolatopsis minnesotensis]|uniref:NAD(P)-dependent oxidoreductase n=1 Tax=Amycolatopsis minnesotensis TaxID=337894 RepID=A0ABP5BCF6_9PSEU
MRVLVAGASGVLGRSLVPLLRARGHHVTAMVRNPASGVIGADDVVLADALDREAVHAAVLTAKPRAIVHQLSALRGHDLETTARLRTEGTANLLTAARESGADRFVAQSIAFATAPVGDPVGDEDAPLYLDAPDEGWARTVSAVAELERLVLHAKDVAGVVLRYGTLYGRGTWYHPGGAVGAALAAGRFRLPEVARGITSFVHVEDAALAAVTAVGDAGDVRGTFNITDDDPAEAEVWAPELARAFGGPEPRRVPAELAERLHGWFGAHQLTALRGAANDRARQALNWKPARPTWRRGIAGDDR